MKQMFEMSRLLCPNCKARLSACISYNGRQERIEYFCPLCNFMDEVYEYDDEE